MMRDIAAVVGVGLVAWGLHDTYAPLCWIWLGACGLFVSIWSARRG